MILYLGNAHSSWENVHLYPLYNFCILLLMYKFLMYLQGFSCKCVWRCMHVYVYTYGSIYMWVYVCINLCVWEQWSMHICFNDIGIHFFTCFSGTSIPAALVERISMSLLSCQTSLSHITALQPLVFNLYFLAVLTVSWSAPNWIILNF